VVNAAGQVPTLYTLFHSEPVSSVALWNLGLFYTNNSLGNSYKD